MAKKIEKKKTVKETTSVADGAEIEEVKTGGMGFEDGIVLTTTLLIVLALVLVYLASQKYG